MTKTKKQAPKQTAQEKDLERAKDQAKTQYESIAEMVQALNDAEKNDNGGDNLARESAEQAIHEDALSVEVRTGWYAPGQANADSKPAEYMILLCTGGPACRLIGNLSEYGEPESARLEYQDWFTPWTDYPLTGKQQDVLLTYARQFYFGE